MLSLPHDAGNEGSEELPPVNSGTPLHDSLARYAYIGFVHARISTLAVGVVPWTESGLLYVVDVSAACS